MCCKRLRHISQMFYLVADQHEDTPPLPVYRPRCVISFSVKRKKLYSLAINVYILS